MMGLMKPLFLWLLIVATAVLTLKAGMLMLGLAFVWAAVASPILYFFKITESGGE